MTTSLYPEFFNDVFGPVMQPGSSSHTAGPCRLGYMAHHLLGERPRAIRIVLDPRGSFAGTFGLMAEDSAMVAGALGLLPGDPDLFRARLIAKEAGIAVTFDFAEITESEHPNAMKFVLTGSDGREVSLVGDSTGGGMVETRTLEGFSLRLRGDGFALLVHDVHGMLGDTELAAIAGGLDDLVCRRTLLEPGLGALHVFEAAARCKVEALRRRFPGVTFSLLEPVLPVLTRPERRPQLFDTMTRWREIAEERGLSLWEVAVLYETEASGWSRDEVIAAMREIAQVMHRQTRAAYEEGVEVPVTPFRPNMAAEWAAHQASGRRLTDDLTANVIRWAYGAGAGIPGVKTVPGPMGSGGGYVYAALSAVRATRGFSDDDLLRGLFVAAGVGAIAFSRTEPTGEAIGCTGECGMCGAMAAAAIAEMAGGDPQQVEDAASLSLQAAIGMPCDPIPGGLSQPCRSRVIAAACMSVVFADLALAGRGGVLPLHEVIDVADAVGRALPPELLCTSRGGAAAAPTALRRAAEYQAWAAETEVQEIPRPPANLI
ncbi:MAG: L-serine ammonia-lyase, iron-sulfur-dependent, subunit alpha [Thermoleophilia bacterium]|nr:L-serine ammonia-lyase, iron-sulfur-dependent, subunit alpha [Thermoleophilia bacterium]